MLAVDDSTNYALLLWAYALCAFATLVLFGVEQVWGLWKGVWIVVRGL
jgi:hypothetical protein